VSGTLNATPQTFQLYSSGIYNDPSCTSTNLTHHIVIVGYGTENNTPFWWIRNSWGRNWGQDGYMQLHRGNNLCGVETEVYTPQGLRYINDEKKFLIDYFPNWTSYSDNMDPLVHDVINIAFWNFDSSYRIQLRSNDRDMAAKIVKLKEVKKDLLVLFSVGGWGFNNFTFMAESVENRRLFIESCIQTARQFGLDGVDVDWEYPGDPSTGGRNVDRVNFVTLIREMRDEFEKEARLTLFPRLLVTAAVPAMVSSNYDWVNLEVCFDWINLMTYDMAGAWDGRTGMHTALTGNNNMNCVTSVNQHLRFFDRKKLTLGFGLYGRAFLLRDQDNFAIGAPTTGEAPGDWTMPDIRNFVDGGATEVFDNASQTMFAYKGNVWVSYDNKSTFLRKVDQVVCLQGLLGSMFWAVNNDDRQWSNLRVVKEAQDLC